MTDSDSCVESSDHFFDSVESLSPTDQEFDYGVWVNEPRSVKERREDFLQGMGFVEFRGSCFPVEGERLCETSGAISSSSSGLDTDSVEECSVSTGRESGKDANDLMDESDEDQENESHSSSEFSQTEKPEEVKSARKGKLNRWWSFLANRRSNLKADSFSARMDHEERTKLPVLNRLKVQHKQKSWKEFTGLYSGQEIQAHSGLIWTMKFSPDGQFLASGGSDGIVRVWRVNSADAQFINFPASGGGKVKGDKFGSQRRSSNDSSVLIPDKVFWIEESPVHEFHGHTGDILDLAWTNSNHLLSSSTDKTVRLWNMGSDSCLDIFRHSNYVTCIQFNPVHENYFISGSIDGKVRVWGVSERRVIDWADVRDGFAVGSVVGTCHFFDASGSHLHLNRTIDVQGRKKTLNRITSIQFSRENSHRVMITSEDGKIRVLEGSDIVQKYRGLPKSGSQHSGSFSSSGKHIVSVGDDSRVYLWNYDSFSVPPSKGKSMKSIRSCEHFISEAVSLALPWPCTGTDRSLLGINSCKNLQYCLRRSEYPSEARDSDRFSIGNWFSIEGPCLGTATWPEEKLPPSELSDEERYELQPQNKQDCYREEIAGDRVRVSETWGAVIVSASFDGKIRTYHNYGLPVRL
ncbi:hypothetical protein CRG98_037379 [Punica granatum]|uniref:Uncharacterized protein n=1 Tax=Punica granatum TaxID=22663 RepID=A0A2I0IEP2_PUNGR|nr:hypothetical protein CRG98_037379 [Punica granatum]